METTFLSAAEVARELGCSTDSINRYAREGLLKPAGTLGSGWTARLYTRQEVERFKAERAKKRAVRKRVPIGSAINPYHRDPADLVEVAEEWAQKKNASVDKSRV